MTDTRYYHLTQIARAFGFTLTPQGKGIVGHRDEWRCVIDPSGKWIFYNDASTWGGGGNSDTPFDFAAMLHHHTGLDYDEDLFPASFEQLRKRNH